MVKQTTSLWEYDRFNSYLLNRDVLLNMLFSFFLTHKNERLLFKALALSNMHESVWEQLNTPLYLGYLNHVFFDNKFSDIKVAKMIEFCEKKKQKISEYKLYYDTLKCFEKIPKLKRYHQEILYGYLIIAAYESSKLKNEDAAIHYKFLANILKQLLIKNKVYHHFWTIKEIDTFVEQREKDCLNGTNKPFLTKFLS